MKLFKNLSRKCQPIVLALSAALAVMPVIGRAAETVIPVTPPGSTDIDQATLPPQAGLYGGFVTLPYNQNSRTYDRDGNSLPPQEQLHVNINVYAPIFVYVYPFHPFGGTVASAFAQPFENLNYSVASSPTTTEFNRSDAYSDLFFWSKDVGLLGAKPGLIPMAYGLSTAFGLALIVPDGNYNPQKLLKLSAHSWVIDPNFALTYNAGRIFSFSDNTQFSTRVFYAIPQKDFTTDYKTGNILNVDASMTEQFGSLRVGVAGYYQTQITNDNPGHGVSLPNGNKYTLAGIGPVVEYFFPRLGVFLKAKYNYTFYVRNSIDVDALVLSAGFKF